MSALLTPDQVIRAEVLLVSLLDGLAMGEVMDGHTIAVQVPGVCGRVESPSQGHGPSAARCGARISGRFLDVPPSAPPASILVLTCRVPWVQAG